MFFHQFSKILPAGGFHKKIPASGRPLKGVSGDYAASSKQSLPLFK